MFPVQVHIITLLAQQKYSHFLPVLDVYISRHFSATLAYKWACVYVRACVSFNIVHYSSLFQYFLSIYYGPYSCWKLFFVY